MVTKTRRSHIVLAPSAPEAVREAFAREWAQGCHPRDDLVGIELWSRGELGCNLHIITVEIK